MHYTVNMEVNITEALKTHPGAYDIYVLLCSGWTPHRTATFVSRKHGVYAAPDDVAEFAGSIPEAHFINIGTLVEKVQNMDVVYNVPGEMVEMLILVRQRIEALTLMDVQNIASSKEMTSMIKIYFDLMSKYLDAMDKLGFIPDAKQKRKELPAPTPSEAEVTTLGDVLDGRPVPATAAALRPKALQPG